MKGTPFLIIWAGLTQSYQTDLLGEGYLEPLWCLWAVAQGFKVAMICRIKSSVNNSDQW